MNVKNCRPWTWTTLDPDGLTRRVRVLTQQPHKQASKRASFELSWFLSVWHWVIPFYFFYRPCLISFFCLLSFVSMHILFALSFTNWFLYTRRHRGLRLFLSRCLRLLPLSTEEKIVWSGFVSLSLSLSVFFHNDPLSFQGSLSIVYFTCLFVVVQFVPLLRSNLFTRSLYSHTHVSPRKRYDFVFLLHYSNSWFWLSHAFLSIYLGTYLNQLP